MARSRVVRSRGPRRTTTWFDIPPTSTIMTASGGTLVSVLNAAALALRPFTIVRTHLLVHITSDQLAADEIQMAAVGFAVVSDQASAAGVGSIPTPVTENGSDLWFLHQFVINEFALNSAIGFDANAGHQYLIDSKAMRKVDIGQDVVQVAEQTTFNGVIVNMAGRMLVKNN